MKEKLINAVNKYYREFRETSKRMVLRRLIYTIIAAMGLINGSRISETVKAFCEFVKKGPECLIKIKISKSDSIKTTKAGIKRKSKPRFREMKFPKNWFDKKIFLMVRKKNETRRLIDGKRLRKRVLDHLLNNFNCNTHSLRYACINYLLYDKKRPVNDVAAYVGHANLDQLVTYTQHHRVNEIHEDDEM